MNSAQIIIMSKQSAVCGYKGWEFQINWSLVRDERSHEKHVQLRQIRNTPPNQEKAKRTSALRIGDQVFKWNLSQQFAIYNS